MLGWRYGGFCVHNRVRIEPVSEPASAFAANARYFEKRRPAFRGE